MELLISLASDPEPDERIPLFGNEFYFSSRSRSLLSALVARFADTTNHDK